MYDINKKLESGHLCFLLVDELDFNSDNDLMVKIIFMYNDIEEEFVVSESIIKKIVNLVDEPLMEDMIFELALNEEILGYLRSSFLNENVVLSIPIIKVRNITDVIYNQFDLFKQNIKETEIKKSVTESFWFVEEK